tara:strand:+ start:316 stop:1233 length:918 start_codon:yes stop_codon:yes gene_type:complete
MKMTNVHNLPETFMQFNRSNAYTSGDAEMGVTTLIDSPRVRTLRGKYAESLTEDISDQVMSILGTAVHNILEQGASPEDVVEERLYGEIGGVKFSGQIDIRSPVVDPGTGETRWAMRDYKTCAGYALKANPQGKREWTNQLNMYGLLASMNDIDVESLGVVAIVRDWRRKVAERDPTYPQSAVVTVPVEKWSVEKAVAYAEERCRSHRREDIPNCTPAETWETGSTYAVHKMIGSGKLHRMASRATRLFDDEDESYTWVGEQSGGTVKYVVNERSGKRVRCEDNYCGVSEYCDQFAMYQAQKEVK